MNDRVLRPVFDNNKRYLKSLSMDSILYWYRKKAGLPAPGEPYHYRRHWEDNVKGTTVGLFMMGAANSLRWEADDELSPNPPKDTDGRREDSGRGWVRELQGRWPGVLG